MLPGEWEGWEWLITKGQEETCGNDGQVHCLVCGDGFTGYTYIKTH